MSDEGRLQEVRNVAELATQYINEHANEAVPASERRHYSKAHEAAALLSRFRISDLTSIGASTDDIEDVLGDSVAVADLMPRGAWTMIPSVRAGVLRQIAGENRLTESIREVESKIVGAADDSLRRSLEQLDRSGRAALQDLSLNDLATVAPVLGSIEGVIPNFPGRDEAERRLGLLRLLEPFDRLVGNHFRGRAKELTRLRAYVDVLESKSAFEAITRVFSFSRKRPFLVHGVGGVGKSTLIAKFILEHTKGTYYSFPFAYLDYDRRAVMVDEPATILVEAVRQFGLQYPDARRAALSLCQSWQSLLASAAPTLPPGEAVNPNSPLHDEILAARQRIRGEFVSFLDTLKIGPELPVLLVLDTFEEVQYRSKAYVDGLQFFLNQLREDIPRLRVVLVGRAEIAGFEVDSDSIELDEFDAEAAVGFLESNGIPDPEIAATIVKRVSGNPLSLRLAVQVFALEGIEGITSLSRKTNIQGQLFERILQHVHTPEVQKIAHPGLALRRVTADIIREVLAEPCKIEVPDRDTAERLFEELKREVALVTPAESGVVTHRSDVRKLMLDPLRESEPVKVEEIHKNAVRYYSRFSDPISRAEEIYHRLALREPPDVVGPRFDPNMKAVLKKELGHSIDELAPPEQAYLADQIELEIPPEARAAATQEIWERSAERRLDEYLRQRNYVAAIELLEERKDRSARTMVRVREAMVHLGAGDLATADMIATDAIRAYGFGGNNRALFEALMVAADVAEQLDIFNEALEHLLRAEKIARQEQDDVRLVRALVGRVGLRNAEGQPADDELIGNLSEASRRVTEDEWLNDPPLLRMVASLVGERDPQLVATALRLAAPSRLPPDRARLMETVLKTSNLGTDRIAEAVAQAVSGLSTPPALLDLALQWLRSEATFATDDTTRGRRKKSLVKRADVGPLLTALHPRRDEIASIVEHTLNRSLDSISFAHDDATVLSDVLDAAEKGYWLAELVDAIRLAHRDPELLRVLDQLGMGVSISTAGSLSAEEIASAVTPNRGLIANWQHAICRIEESSKQCGSGFLVSADRILTARSALPAVPASATIRFDYGELGGTTYNPGASARVQEASILGDGKHDPVFLTLDRQVGHELIGGSRATPLAFRRAWIESEPATPPSPSSPVFWLWHSAGQIHITGAHVESVSETELVLDTKGRTEHAGAPCFDGEFRLLGVHCGAHPTLRGKTLVTPIARARELDSVRSSLWFVDDRPVIDRVGLRKTLLEMTGTNGPRILLVDGPFGSGKSFTTKIIHQLARRIHFDVLSLEIDRLSGLSPFEIGQLVNRTLDLPEPPAPGTESAARWTARYLDALTGHLRKNAQPLWIILDGFENEPPLPAMQDFIVALATRIKQDLKNTRLVLLGYAGTLPAAVLPLVARDQIGTLSSSDITELFLRLYRERMPDAGDAEVNARATAAASEIAERAAEEQGLTAREISDWLRKVDWTA